MKRSIGLVFVEFKLLLIPTHWTLVFDVFDNDTDYLNSIKGMPEKIIAGMKEPLNECIPSDEVEW